MSFTTGTRLGVYEISGALGAGGMGAVYRARDTKLGRDVAIKVVTDSFDPEHAARFRREAQLLAALNHPHIATIHGLEEANPSTGSGQAAVQFLVMELVEGGTLVERIRRPEGLRLPADGSGRPSGLPIDEALTIARQVAEALQAAHEKGIIHRDLKPSNIAFTADGQVKVLDFGLAKALAPAGSGTLHDSPALLATHSPTLSMAATQAGVILGTAAYMAPEQAKGREADKRCDVWAFGCVLYEMLTGRRAFDGEDISDIMGAVLRLEPEWAALPTDVPPAVQTLLKRCLAKDRRTRMADISTALYVLDEADEYVGRVPRSESEQARRGPAADAGSAGALHADPAYVRHAWRRIAVFSAAALVVGAAAAGTSVWLATRPAPPRVSRVTITPAGTSTLTINGNNRDIAITPDGTRIVYVGNNGTQLFVRPIDSLEPAAIATGGISNVFTSADGQWVGFSSNFTDLSKVSITGGPSIAIARADGSRMRGATWGPRDTIIFATNSISTGLQRVGASGGNTEVLTRPSPEGGEADHMWPEMLPDGRTVLFTITAQSGLEADARIAALDLETGEHKVLMRGGTHAQYVASGHLVYAAAGTLRAVAFDLDRLETIGSAAPVVPRLATTSFGGADFAVGRNGTLVYVDAPGRVGGATRTLTWVDRSGREQPTPAPPRDYLHPRVSPDGVRVALWVGDQESDIWMWDLARATLTRLTFDPSGDNFPVWTPDGRQLVFSSGRASGVQNLFVQAADGTGAAQRLTESDNTQLVSAVTADGKWAIFSELTPATRRDVMRVALDGDHRVEPLVQTPFEERNGIVSPDGRWLAYQSDSSGRTEVYVRPFPDVADGLWQVSTAGGSQPLWSRTGDELFYIAADESLTTVRVGVRGTAWDAGTPTTLTEGRYFTGGDGVVTGGRTYDVSPDGQRFLMIKPVAADQTVPPVVVLVQNWFEELKRLVPVN